jgi:hypothetical protein
MPTSRIAAMMSDVATGRRMKGVEMLIALALPPKLPSSRAARTGRPALGSANSAS